MDSLDTQIENLKELSTKVSDHLWENAPVYVMSALTFFVGLWVIRWLTSGVRRVLTKRQVDPSLTPFLVTLSNVILKTTLVISCVSMVGIEMTSFVTILGAAGLAIALSLQGTLSNFASGIMILTFKPFKAGDYIEGGGHAGTVREIQIFNTILTTPDNKRIILPNGSIAGSSVTNFSAETTRRVEWIFGIAYGDNYDKAREVLLQYIHEDGRILNDPEPFIALHALADSSVNVVVRVWVATADFWPVFFDLNEKVYKGFGEHGLNIPFPQMDVHLHQRP